MGSPVLFLCQQFCWHKFIPHIAQTCNFLYQLFLVPQLVPHRCDSFVWVLKTNNLKVCKSSCKVSLIFCLILTEIEMCLSFSKPPNRKFHESPPDGSCTVACGQLDECDETGS